MDKSFVDEPLREHCCDNDVDRCIKCELHKDEEFTEPVCDEMQPKLHTTTEEKQQNTTNCGADNVPSGIQQKLEEMQEKFGFRRPQRPDVDDPEVEWRHGRPCFDKADLEFFSGRTMCHQDGSLEDIVENLVKRWEMELSHKAKLEQWQTVDLANFALSANGGRNFSSEEIFQQGNYQALLSQCKKSLYNSEQEDFNTSHEIFRGAFTNGFPWEVLRVFSPPPRVVFTWRHWGRFCGQYKGREGDGQTINMYGITVADVNEQLQIRNLEVYYDPDMFLERLSGERTSAERTPGEELIGSGCPMIPRAVSQSHVDQSKVIQKL